MKKGGSNRQAGGGEAKKGRGRTGSDARLAEEGKEQVKQGESE
jgi:hypothetical protein